MPGEFITINGSRVELVRGNATDAQIEQILRTLRAIPPGHIKIVPKIEIFAPHDGYRGGDSGLGYVRISELCFGSGWNSGEYNVTALHEIGHLVDYRWGCMTWLRRNARAHYDTLLAHPHTGDRTHGPGEHFADAYADYFNRNRGQVHISRPRRQALLATPAFQHMPAHPAVQAGVQHMLRNPRTTGYGAAQLKL